MRWTEREREVLAESANLGWRGVRKALRSECGTNRSEWGIKQEAHRLGVSLVRYGACACGKLSRDLNADGLCPVCAARATARAAWNRAELLKRTRVTKEEKDAIEDARRSAAAARSRCRNVRRNLEVGNPDGK